MQIITGELIREGNKLNNCLENRFSSPPIFDDHVKVERKQTDPMPPPPPRPPSVSPSLSRACTVSLSHTHTTCVTNGGDGTWTAIPMVARKGRVLFLPSPPLVTQVVCVWETEIKKIDAPTGKQADLFFGVGFQKLYDGFSFQQGALGLVPIKRDVQHQTGLNQSPHTAMDSFSNLLQIREVYDQGLLYKICSTCQSDLLVG